MKKEDLNEEEQRQVEIHRLARQMSRQDARCEEGKHASEKEEAGKKVCSHCGAELVAEKAPVKKSKFASIV